VHPPTTCGRVFSPSFRQEFPIIPSFFSEILPDGLDEIDVKDEHRNCAKKQGKRKEGYGDIEGRRFIAHLDQHKLIRGDQEINKKESDEEFPGKEDDSLNPFGQSIKNKLDDDEGPPFIHRRDPYEDDIGDEEHAQF